MPVGYDKQDTMFPTAPFNMTSYIEGCESYYGVPPRQHWITTYFGIQVYIINQLVLKSLQIIISLAQATLNHRLENTFKLHFWSSSYLLSLM